jgi:hypothetical protein
MAHFYLSNTWNEDQVLYLKKLATTVAISFILLYSIVSILIFSKMDFLPVFAKNGSATSNSNNATTTTIIVQTTIGGLGNTRNFEKQSHNCAA